MSFAVALATGFFNRATKNIDKEDALILKDDEKISGLETQLFEAVLKPADKRPAPDAINAIKDIIKGAKTQQKERGKIDMFGRPGKRIDLDLMKTANLINQVDSGYLNFGGYKMPVDKLYGSKSLLGKPFEQGNLFLRAIDTHISNPTNKAKFLMHLKNNKTAMSDYQSKLGLHSRLFLNGYSKTLSNDGDKTKPYTTIGDNFFNLPSFAKITGGLDDNPLNAIENLASEGDFKLPAMQKGQVYFQGLDKNGVRQAVPYSFQNKEDYQALSTISSRMGYKRPSDFIFQFQNYVPELVLQEGENPQTMYNYIFDSIELEKMNFSGKTRSGTQKKQIADFLIKKYGNNRGRMSLAVLPLIANVGNANAFHELNMNRVMGQPRARQIEEIYNLKDGEITKITDNYKDMVAVRNDLRKLIQLRKDLPTGSGLVEDVTGLSTSIFGEGGQIDQIGNVLGGSDGGEDFDVARGNRAVRDFLGKYKSEGTDQEKLGKIDSIVISLAAKMARAVDPAGRLSNQDFEVQLRRLGSAGIFTNKPRQLAALNETLADFQGQLNRLKVINEMVDRTQGGGFSLTRMERRQLFADKAVQDVLQDVGADAFSSVSGREFSYDVAKQDGRVSMSPNHVGPRGEPVEVVFDRNNNQVSGMYFMNGQPVARDQIQFVTNQNKGQDIRSLYTTPSVGQSVVGDDPATLETGQDTKNLIVEQQNVQKGIKENAQRLNRTTPESSVDPMGGSYSESDVKSYIPLGLKDGVAFFEITLVDGTIISDVKKVSGGWSK